MRKSALLATSILISTMAGASPLMAADASEETRILRIDVRVEGTEAWKQNGSWEKGEISQRYVLATTLRGASSLSAVNALDDESTRKAGERSAEVQRRAASASAAQNPGGGPSQAQIETMNNAIAAVYARCNGDEACITAAVMKANPAMMQPPPGATMRAPAAMEEMEEAPEVYQQWLAPEACPGKILVRRNDKAEGQIQDVGGPRARKAEISIDEKKPVDGACNSYSMTVVDVAKKQLFLAGYSFPATPVRIVTTGTAPEPVTQGVPTIPDDVQVWINKNLRGIALKGTKTETIALKVPVVVSPWQNYAGRVKITMSWSLTEPWSGASDLAID